MTFQSTITAQTMQHVYDWAIANDNRDYANAIKRTSDHFDYRPLMQIPASVSAIKQAMPLDGFDPSLAKTEKAYKARRRKIIAAVKRATGEMEAAARRRARQDEWSDFLEVLKPYAVDKNAEPSPQILIPIRKLADIARQHQRTPAQISQDWLNTHRKTIDPGHWRTFQRGLKTLNKFRAIDEVRAFLPPDPFPPGQKIREQLTPGVPDDIAEEIDRWVENATKGKLDPVEMCYVAGNSASDIAHKRAALRKFVSALYHTPDFSLESAQGLKGLLTPENAILVIRYWSSNQTRKNAISERTAHDYMKSIYVVQSRNGMDPSAIKSQLGANRFLAQGKKNGAGMCESARKFCENLLGDPTLTRKFLSMHVHMRNRAKKILDQCAAENRQLKEMELNRLRQIGTIAAFCAIETRGAPIRVTNALSLRFWGKNHDFHLPTDRTKHALIVLAPDQVKNKSKIWAPIMRDNMNGLEVIEWYMRHIRPLFPKAEESEYLFPSLKGNAHLPYKTFLTWLKRHSREYGLPMCPHKFRHGLASLLLQRNPARWDLLERLLDDTVATVSRNYAWVNERAKREEVQKYILDLTVIGK